MSARPNVPPATLPGTHQRLPAGQRIGRHRHAAAYAAVVLEGGYDEAGDCGRRRLVPGDVVFHAAFSGHANAVARTGARLLNLPLPHRAEGFARLADADAVARLARRDVRSAVQRLMASSLPVAAEIRDWPDLLARDLALDPRLALGDWAARHGLAPETLSRGFARVFGLTPKRLRHEMRARRALHAAMSGDTGLADLALDTGFADQAHMTHAVTWLTGHPPGHWRDRSIADKTGR